MKVMCLHRFCVVLFFACYCLIGCADSELDFDKLTPQEGEKLIHRSTQWVVPAAYTDLRLNDYVDLDGNRFLLKDRLGNYMISIIDTIYRGSVSDYVEKIELSTLSQGVSIDKIPSVGTKALDTFVDLDITTDPVGLQLKELEFSEGDVSFGVVNNTDADLQFVFTVPSLTNAVTVSVTVPSGETVEQTTSLAGVSVYTGGAFSRRYNRIRFPMKVTNLKTEEEAAVGTSSITISFNNISWSFARGYLGTSNTNIPRTLHFTQIDNTLGGGSVTIEEARTFGSYYELTTISQIGVPFLIESLVGFYRFSDDLLNPAFRSFPVRLYGRYPTIEMRGQTTEYTQRYGENEKLDTILSFKPNRYTHEGNVVVNQGRSAGVDTNQFVEASSTYKVVEKFFMPFRFAEIGSIYLEDKISSILTADIDTTTFVIDTATLHVQGMNSFPIAISLSVFFLDESGNHYDTLNLATPIAPATVDTDGYVTKEAAFNSIVPMDRDALKEIKKLSSIVVRATFRKDYNQTPASFSSKNFIRIGFGVEAKVRTKL